MAQASNEGETRPKNFPPKQKHSLCEQVRNSLCKLSPLFPFLTGRQLAERVCANCLCKLFLSGGRTVPSKRLFKENAPFILFVLMGSFAEHSFLKHFRLGQFSVIQGRFYIQRFSNTSFGRTLLGSSFGGLLLEQTLVGTLRPSHFICVGVFWGWVAFPWHTPRI